MARNSSDVTEAELAILEVLWSDGPQSMGRLAETLYGQSNASNNSTVQKLLSRLEAKGCVERDRQTWPHSFSASVARDDLVARRLRNTADQLCDGSLTPLLTHLVSSGGLSAKEKAELKKLLGKIN